MEVIKVLSRGMVCSDLHFKTIILFNKGTLLKVNRSGIKGRIGGCSQEAAGVVQVGEDEGLSTMVAMDVGGRGQFLDKMHECNH